MATETDDRLAVVLYLLMRDVVPVGAVTHAIRRVEQPDMVGDPTTIQGDDTRWLLTNEPLLALAASLAERIRGGEA